MTELTRSSSPKKQDYTKWAEAQPSETLQEEIRTLESKLTDLQHREEEINQPESGAPLWLYQQVEGQIAEVRHCIEDVRREQTARRIQGLLNETKPPSVGEPKGKKHSPNVAARNAVIAANSNLKPLGICQALDSSPIKIELPTGLDWEPYRSHENPWTDAYKKGDKKLKAYIRTIFSKAKTALQ